MQVMVLTEIIWLVFPLQLFVGSIQINQGNTMMFNNQKACRGWKGEASDSINRHHVLHCRLFSEWSLYLGAARVKLLLLNLISKCPVKCCSTCIWIPGRGLRYKFHDPKSFERRYGCLKDR